VRTIVISDLHLGTYTRRDLLRRPAARAALAERVRAADHVVLLGDVLELREIPIASVLAEAEPFFRELGDAAAGGRVTLVAGNHDHQLAAPVLEAGAPGLARSAPPASGGPTARIAEWLGKTSLELAYPGVWLGPDVYATHGHYLDCHAAIPALERLAVAATERVTGGPPPGARAVADYEAATEPLYSLLYSLAQASRRRRSFLGGGGRSARAWVRLAGRDGRRDIGSWVAAGVLLPAAVAALNRAGVGPLTSDLSGPSLRRSSLRAMADVVASLGIGAAHVVFGHTHRPGPLPRDDASEWDLPGGGRLINTGSWLHEPAFLGGSPRESPYWPGTCVVVEDDEPPRVERLLDALPASGP
jgi:predicted phosphodiesterase